MSRRRLGDRAVIAAAALVVTVGLWAVGSWIVRSRTDVAGAPDRLAIARTDDGAALRLLVGDCGAPVRRISLLQQGDGVVWEVKGMAGTGQTSFVVGLAASPMAVTQTLDEPLDRAAGYRLEVETNRVDIAEFTLREVPPVGVLHEGRETTVEGFLASVERAYCQADRLPFLGSLVAQILVLVAGAALAVVAAGYLSGGSDRS